jgi:hypothetical protein
MAHCEGIEGWSLGWRCLQIRRARVLYRTVLYKYGFVVLRLEHYLALWDLGKGVLVQGPSHRW